MEHTIVGDYRLRLESLRREGHALRERLHSDHPSATVVIARSWQQACGVIVNELSGGSKAHWLARAFSDAFLVPRSAEAPLDDIVDRILAVLDSADQSLGQIADAPIAAAETAPPVRRFDFVHDATLGPVLEQAYRQARTAFAEGRFAESLLTTCGVLEAILTDALTFAGHHQQCSFEVRIAAAEQAGLIGRGCARLPSIARNYRDLTDDNGQLQNEVAVTARDASTTTQVLHVVMRDLNPGR
jgi:hypothetical protein